MERPLKNNTVNNKGQKKIKQEELGNKNME
jgi:hypothetical protein